ncbi:MAG: exosome complex protein Rrp42 [archaeon]
MIKETLLPNIEKKGMLDMLNSGKRLDGRKFDEFRPVRIETGVYERAEGSASAWIGKTFVAAGIKIGEGEPYPDSPNVGVLSTNAELCPMASPTFQAGPPGEEVIEIARVVDRGIRESKAIELEKLCIEPGVKTRMVYIDAYMLDYHGNAIDAASLASVAALYNTEIPDFGKLPIVKKPIANTFIKIGENILLDPSLEEERAMDARLTVTIEDTDRVCAMQKAGSGFWMQDEIMQCVETAIKMSKDLRKLI